MNAGFAAVTPVAPVGPDDATAESFKVAMRRVGSSVAIVTSAHGTQRGGLTATAVCPVCVEPPSLLVCVNRASHTHGLIEASGRFAVNVLEEGQGDVANTFAGRTGEEGDGKFAAAGVWEVENAGLPILKETVAFVTCSVIHSIRLDTHTVFIGRVAHVGSNVDGRPLIYTDRHFARLHPLAE